MSNPYAYDEAVDIDFAAITSGALVSGTDFDVTLVDQEFPGGVLADRAFLTQYDGAIELDIDQNRNITFSISVEHTLGDGTSFESSRRGFFSRVTRGQEFYLPLNVFSSHSVVSSDDYSPDVFEQDTRIRVMLHINSNNDANIEMLQPHTAGVWFHQLNDIPALPAPYDPVRPTIDDTSSLKERIDATLAVNNWKHGKVGREELGAMPRAYSSMIKRFSVAAWGRLVPVVGVTAYFGVTSRNNIEKDIEATIEELITILNAVPDCQPERGVVEIDYAEDGYITFEIECVGV